MNIQALLCDRFRQAMLLANVPPQFEPQITYATKSQFGDYQMNGVMAAAKSMAVAPRQLAERIVQQLDLVPMASKVEIAGPGFINIFLDRIWLAEAINPLLGDERLGISPTEPQTVVIDYSSPNIAKEMHVGHLRSTIIGDAMVRTLTFLRHNVIRANHVGDWGTQFGMLIALLEEQQDAQQANLALADLEHFYRQAKQRYDSDSLFAARARDYVVKLQRGDAGCRQLWQKLVDVTLQHNQQIYDRLNVTLTRDDAMGESLYNPMLPAIVADLKTKKMAVESNGAVVVYLDNFKNKDGEPMGVIIQKQDGGYLYTTTDIACAKYRYETLHADRIIYYVDSRQHQHLAQAWQIVRQAGYVPASVSLEHHMFGMMLGSDGRPFKTRSGDVIKLADFLDEACQRARKLVSEKNSAMTADEVARVADILAIGAVKYADLSRNRNTDYLFNWDTMLSFEGNTAPYLLYAYARILSLFKKADIDIAALHGQVILIDACEVMLALKLVQFEEIILQVAREGLPHLMCTYLYELAALFSSLYENCPILSTKEHDIRQSRLILAALTARILKQGLDTLGIETVERM